MNINSAKYLFKAIDVIIDRRLEKLKFDKTISGVITANNQDGTYDVKIHDNESKIPAREGITLNVGDIVYIRCVQGDYSWKFIDCKRPTGL